ncbi:MAG: 3,4-dihydroxy-2-butanone-4-phosphate synthase [Longimicrobiales bacterium]
MALDSVEDAIQDIRDGRIVIVADDEDRENEGDLVCAGERITPDLINFMTKIGRGLICVAMVPDRADALGLPLMTEQNTDPHGTAFTVSVDAGRQFGVTTGISAHDRAKTVQVLVDPDSTPGDLRRPGHIFPLRARPGGVLRRVGQTEASVDLARLAGLSPVGVICEILNEDGSMARRGELEIIARDHDLRFITVKQLVSYRLARERLVERVATSAVRTRLGNFDMMAYRSDLDSRVHLALVKGDVFGKANVLVRMHAENVLTDTFGSAEEDVGNLLAGAMQRIDREGQGVIVYIRSDRAGERLVEKLGGTVASTDEGDALRDYGVGAQILLDLGLNQIRLLTNSQRKIVGLDGYALEVVGREPFSEDCG